MTAVSLPRLRMAVRPMAVLALALLLSVTAILLGLCARLAVARLAVRLPMMNRGRLVGFAAVRMIAAFGTRMILALFPASTMVATL